jgi:hypothetical protein
MHAATIPRAGARKNFASRPTPYFYGSTVIRQCFARSGCGGGVRPKIQPQYNPEHTLGNFPSGEPMPTNTSGQQRCFRRDLVRQQSRGRKERTMPVCAAGTTISGVHEKKPAIGSLECIEPDQGPRRKFGAYVSVSSGSGTGPPEPGQTRRGLRPRTWRCHRRYQQHAHDGGIAEFE